MLAQLNSDKHKIIFTVFVVWERGISNGSFHIEISKSYCQGFFSHWFVFSGAIEAINTLCTFQINICSFLKTLHFKFYNLSLNQDRCLSCHICMYIYIYLSI